MSNKKVQKDLDYYFRNAFASKLSDLEGQRTHVMQGPNPLLTNNLPIYYIKQHITEVDNFIFNPCEWVSIKQSRGYSHFEYITTNWVDVKVNGKQLPRDILAVAYNFNHGDNWVLFFSKNGLEKVLFESAAIKRVKIDKNNPVGKALREGFSKLIFSQEFEFIIKGKKTITIKVKNDKEKLRDAFLEKVTKELNRVIKNTKRQFLSSYNLNNAEWKQVQERAGINIP